MQLSLLLTAIFLAFSCATAQTQFTEPMAKYQEYATAFRGSLSNEIRQASLLLREGKWAEAKKLFTYLSGMTTGTHHQSDRFWIAACIEMEGDKEAAIAYYERTARYFPESFWGKEASTAASRLRKATGHNKTVEPTRAQEGARGSP